MPKYVDVSEEQIQWLRENHERFSYNALARKIGVHVDTLKRILAREDIAEFEGAKYTPALMIKQWERPCIQCGSTQRRPKGWYMCGNCRRKAGYEEY